MQPLLSDEGLPPAVPRGLAAFGLSAHAVGDPGAPPRQSSDEDNVKWCKANGAVLVTNDWGRKDKAILDALAHHHVHAIFVPNELRSASAHHLARALLCAEVRMDELVGAGKLIRHRLKPTGRLEKR